MQDDNDESAKSPPQPPADEEAAVPPPSPGPEPDREYPVDRIRRRFERSLGGRPLMVYLVLFAGAAVLLVLLVIVWVSATGDNNEQPPPCFDITVPEAQTAIRDGVVERVEIFLDRERPELGPSVIRLALTDGTCRELPKGADNIDQAYVIVGFVDVYNSTHEERVRVAYRRTDVLPELLVTSTPTATVTPTPLPTETPTATLAPTETPTVVPTVVETPAIPASPEASEETTPATPDPTVSVVVASPVT
jgi:hypothetical protein